METIDVTLRPLLSGDVSAGMRLKTISGWNQTEKDWTLYLTVSPGGCFAAVADDAVVGTVITIPYGNSIAWIGMMLVDPVYRRKGVAARLMRHAIHHLADCRTIKLDATPAGKKVYDGFGFEDEYCLYRMTTPLLTVAEDIGGDVTPVTEGDMDAIMDIDREVFGADRGAVIAAFARNNPESAWKVMRSGRLCGYCTGRQGTRYYQIGPIVALSARDAVCLVKAPVSKLSGRSVVIDVPSTRVDFLEWLMSVGFSEERYFMRMYIGTWNPGKPEMVFAISGPELG